MSKMSELSITIQERLERGDEPIAIAEDLDVPFEWVQEVIDQMAQANEG